MEMHNYTHIMMAIFALFYFFLNKIENVKRNKEEERNKKI